MGTTSFQCRLEASAALSDQPTLQRSRGELHGEHEDPLGAQPAQDVAMAGASSTEALEPAAHESTQQAALSPTERASAIPIDEAAQSAAATRAEGASAVPISHAASSAAPTPAEGASALAASVLAATGNDRNASLATRLNRSLAAAFEECGFITREEVASISKADLLRVIQLGLATVSIEQLDYHASIILDAVSAGECA